MAYSEKGAAPGPGVEIDIGRVVRILFRKWWLIVALALAVAIAAAVFTEVTREDTFTSTITFIVSNKAEGSGEGADIISQSDLTASINMTNNFKYLLSGKAMNASIAKSLKNKYKADDIGGLINVKTITDTSIIEMNVTSESAAKSLEIAEAAVENYKAVVEVYEGASIGVYAQPDKASKPDTDTSAIRNAFIGAFVGVALACVIIIVMNSSRNTVQSADEIRDILDLTILGTVSQVANTKKNKNANKQRQLLIVDKSSGFGFIETYKAIRTKIEGAALKNGYKTFVISSAVEDEGKTTVATNIAIALALNGKSVLLIDADIRKPAVSKLLGLPTSKEKGLPDVISGAVSTEKAIKFVEKYKLFLLSGSYASADPTEILSMPQTEKLIKDLESEFDFIIIDTPPAGVVTDASIIAAYADAVILVIREDEAPLGRIQMAINDLTGSNAELIGCVYNNVTSSAGTVYGPKRYGRGYRYGRYGYGHYGYGGYGRYGYGYGYGYDYGEEKDKKDKK